MKNHLHRPLQEKADRWESSSVSLFLKLSSHIQKSALLFRHSIIKILRFLKYCPGCPSRQIGSAALRTDCGVIGDRLGENFFIFPLCFGLGMGYVFHFMGTYGISSIFRADMCGRFERNSGVIRTILIFSVFTGLAFVGIEIAPSWDFLAVLAAFWILVLRQYCLVGDGRGGIWAGSAGRNLDLIIKCLLVYGY